MPHPGRGVGNPRNRRFNVQHFGTGGSNLTGLSPSSRENMDPIAELLSQLSSVRNRAAAAQSVSSQLQQLEMQLQSTRQQLERLPRRQTEPSKPPPSSNTVSSQPEPISTHPNAAKTDSQYLLTKLSAENAGFEFGASGGESDMSQRNVFVQELLLATLTEQLSLISDGDSDDPSSILEALRSPESEGDSDASSTSLKENKRSRESPSKVSSIRTVDKAVGGAVEKIAGQGIRPVSAGTYRENSRGHMANTATASSPRQVCSPITVSNSVAVLGPNHGSSSGVSMMQGRASSAPHGARERGLNPASAKRSMLKHMPPQRGASDTDPPPH
ncbi:E3 ubiquitin-protein ligase kcmf1 [Plakobranchus ocellatus]|uniref:E3 ubiquitin-protein ligase kcmf1 n=1 Tax=Plakobranchus ocellatus TaxID=259542 RepID=A0AAV4CXB5_9GAST|nr:E3 ubiquitin-protein ligase kcmf1 [Plakobranchus ocellatus]